jgi:hypothetical protein
MLALALVAAWVTWGRATEEDRVRRVIEGMARDASFTGKEGNLSRIAKVESITAAFTPDAELHIDQVVPVESAITGREVIKGMLLAGLPSVRAIRVQVHDVKVTIEDEDKARAVLTASASAGGSKGEFNAQEFEFRLVRVEGAWRVRRIEAVLGFRRPVIR